MSETDDAIRLANKVLETPSRDPDDDLSMMSRQLLRAIETRDACAQALAEVLPHVEDANNTAPAVATWHRKHRPAIEWAAKQYGRSHLLT